MISFGLTREERRLIDEAVKKGRDNRDAEWRKCLGVTKALADLSPERAGIWLDRTLSRWMNHLHEAAISEDMIREIHRKPTSSYPKAVCWDCGDEWPCLTRRALEGKL